MLQCLIPFFHSVSCLLTTTSYDSCSSTEVDGEATTYYSTCTDRCQKCCQLFLSQCFDCESDMTELVLSPNSFFLLLVVSLTSRSFHSRCHDVPFYLCVFETVMAIKVHLGDVTDIIPPNIGLAIDERFFSFSSVRSRNRTVPVLYVHYYYGPRISRGKIKRESQQPFATPERPT
jgi:hypothetical protein